MIIIKSRNRTLHMMPHHMCTQKHISSPTWQKSSRFDVNIGYACYREIALSWKGSWISLLTLARTCTHTHWHMRTHAHTQARTLTCVHHVAVHKSPRGIALLVLPCQLPWHHAIYKDIFLINLILNKSNEIHEKFKKYLEESLKIRKLITPNYNF